MTSDRITLNRITLNRITLGASSLGERGDEKDAAALADAMLSSPFGQIDPSNMYARGHGERLLGEAIGRAGGLPATTTVFSKTDRDVQTGVFDGDRVKRSFEETTSRLGLDYLPVLHLHDPYTITLSEGFFDAAGPFGG